MTTVPLCKNARRASGDGGSLPETARGGGRPATDVSRRAVSASRRCPASPARFRSRGYDACTREGATGEGTMSTIRRVSRNLAAAARRSPRHGSTLHGSRRHVPLALPEFASPCIVRAAGRAARDCTDRNSDTSPRAGAFGAARTRASVLFRPAVPVRGRLAAASSHGLGRAHTDGNLRLRSGRGRVELTSLYRDSRY